MLGKGKMIEVCVAAIGVYNVSEFHGVLVHLALSSMFLLVSFNTYVYNLNFTKAGRIEYNNEMEQEGG